MKQDGILKKSDTNQPNKTNFIEFVLASNTKNYAIKELAFVR